MPEFRQHGIYRIARRVIRAAHVAEIDLEHIGYFNENDAPLAGTVEVSGDDCRRFGGNELYRYDNEHFVPLEMGDSGQVFDRFNSKAVVEL